MRRSFSPGVCLSLPPAKTRPFSHMELHQASTLYTTPQLALAGAVQPFVSPSPTALRQYLEGLRRTLLAGLLYDEIPVNTVPAPSLGLQLAESIIIPRMMRGRATTGCLRPMQRPTCAAKGPYFRAPSVFFPLPSQSSQQEPDAADAEQNDSPQPSDVEEIRVIEFKPKRTPKGNAKIKAAVKEGRTGTWKQPWSDEEHHLLKKLMVSYPPEEPKRWIKISAAMGGRRTSRQVASRVQKCFGQLRGSRLDPGDISDDSD